MVRKINNALLRENAWNEWLNKHIVYKLDNENTYLNIDGYFYS